MREELELRLSPDQAQAVSLEDEGVLMPMGTVRRIRLPLKDQRWERTRKAEHEASSTGDAFITYWRIRRQYSQAELRRAELVQLLPTCMFEPAGEECGTVYDYSKACEICGAGRVQVSALVLDTSRVPKRCDLAFTIARDEFVTSEKFSGLIARAGLTGLRLRDIVPVNKKGSSPWQQATFNSAALRIDSQTRFGVSPFDELQGGRCPRGHVAGHAILSELFVERASWDGSDFNATAQLVGNRLGLLAPNPLLVVSQRCFRQMAGAGIKGFDAEIVHLT